MGEERALEPQRRDKERVWSKGQLALLENYVTKRPSVSHRRVRERETRDRVFPALRLGRLSVFSSAPFRADGSGERECWWRRGPASPFLLQSLGIPENFQPNSKEALSGFRTMPGNFTQGRGPLLALAGRGLLRREFRPQRPLRPTGLLPFGTHSPHHSLLPHPSSEPLPTHLCPSPGRAQSPPTSTPLGQPLHPARHPISLLQVWGTGRHWGLAGVNSASPATPGPGRALTRRPRSRT